MISRLIQWPLSAAVGLIKFSLPDVERQISDIDLPEYIQLENCPPSWGDRFLRSVAALVAPFHLQLPTGPVREELWTGLRARDDWAFLLLTSAIRVYTWFLRTVGYTWPAGTPDIRRRDMDAWYTENPDFPVLASGLELLEFTLNHMDVEDLVHREDGQTAEVRTTWLGSCDRKDHKVPIGGIIRLSGSVEDKTWRVDEVICEDKTYNRSDLPGCVAHGLTCGIIVCTQVCSHVYDAHCRFGSRLAHYNHDLLPTTHPIRQVLLPIEIKTSNVFSRAALTLIHKPDGWVGRTFPLTWQGLEQMLAKHTPADHAALPGDYGRWWTYIHGYMDRVARVVYKSEEALRADPAACTWLGALDVPQTVDGLSTLLADAFFVQVRHARLSSPAFEHIIRYMHILDPAPVCPATAAQTIAIGRATSEIGGVPLGRNLSGAIVHGGTRDILHEFYEGLLDPAFVHTIVDPALLPAGICTSLNK